jgi:hypothetical protein
LILPRSCSLVSASNRSPRSAASWRRNSISSNSLAAILRASSSDRSHVKSKRVCGVSRGIHDMVFGGPTCRFADGTNLQVLSRPAARASGDERSPSATASASACSERLNSHPLHACNRPTLIDYATPFAAGYPFSFLHRRSKFARTLGRRDFADAIEPSCAGGHCG